MTGASAAAAPIALQSLIEPAKPDVPARGGLSAALRQRYGGDLWIPLRAHRPTVAVNFVSTLDGVTSYATPEAAGGGEISGFFEPDRFVMGLLRSLADAVLIGAGTLRAAPDERWTPRSVHPASADLFAALRRSLGLRADPLTAVVTATGGLDLDHPGLSDPAVDALIVTTAAGAAALQRRPVRPGVEIAVTEHDTITPAAVLGALESRGARLVLCEGGPHLFGQFLAARLVDELFLTIAPQIAGRGVEAPRLGLVEGTAFAVDAARWGRITDLRRAADHLFTRYRLTEETS
jgi:riboflavin biosynthesis pyrimidine reductase